MSDERTLRLAHRPVTPEILERYVRFTQLEQEGTASAEALTAAGISADDAARVASAVNAFCRPRLLKRRLSRAVASSPEKQLKQQQELARAIDDGDFVALYGAQTHQVLTANEQALVDLRVLTRGVSP